MTLADALLNTKKYIKEPIFQQKEKMWAYRVYKNGRWEEIFFLTEEVAWKAFYADFRRIKDTLLNNQNVR